MGLGCCRASSQLENVNNARMIQINHPTELSGVSARPGVDSQLDLKRVEKGAISHCQSWHDCRGGPGTSATGANPSYHDSIATHKGSEGYLPTLLETTELQPEKIVEYLQKILRSTPQDEGQKMQNLRLSLLWCDCGFIVQPHDNHDHCCRRSVKNVLFRLSARMSGQPSVMYMLCCTSSPSNPGPVLENPAIIWPN